MKRPLLFVVVGVLLLLVGGDVVIDVFRRRPRRWVDGLGARFPKVVQILMGAVLLYFGAGVLLSVLGVDVLNVRASLVTIGCIIGLLLLREVKRLGARHNGKK